MQTLVEWINQLIKEDALWKFYKGKEFRHLKEEVLKENHYECIECAKLHKLSMATTVHHVKPVREYPELALSKFYIDEHGKKQIQLEPVCKSCHNRLHPEKWSKSLHKKQTKETFINKERW